MQVRPTLAIGSMLLVAGSWRLWTPQQLFPRVPLFSVLADWSNASTWFDSGLTWCLTLAWLLSMLALAWPKLDVGWQRVLSIAYTVMLAALIALDQHRLQPWGVHVALGLLIVTFMTELESRRWLIWLTASIYSYSAFSKFDAQFLYTVGQEFLNALLKFIGTSASEWPMTARLGAACCFPVGELVCGVGLLWGPTRRAALVMACVMHALLWLVLGPWGLQHSWGVLLWNGLFIALNSQLWWCESHPSRVASESGSFAGASLVRGLVVLAMCVPLGERLGLSDHWLGWALYAPHSSRALIEVSPSAIDQLPEQVRPFVLRDDENPLWARVAVDRWSLESLRVPIYPQQRFYVAVARQLAQPLSEFAIQVTLQGTASRFTGRRDQRVLSGRRALDAEGEKYWFNTSAVVTGDWAGL